MALRRIAEPSPLSDAKELRPHCSTGSFYRYCSYFGEASHHFIAFQSPRSSPTSQARLKSGAFAPPELPGLDALTPLSDSRFRPAPSKTPSRPNPRRTRVSPDYPLLSSNLPRPIPRRTPRVRMSMPSPWMLPSPSPWRVGVRIEPFEACSGYHSSCGRPDRSTAQGGLCREAPARPVAPPDRSPATGPIDTYPGGTFLH